MPRKVETWCHRCGRRLYPEMKHECDAPTSEIEVQFDLGFQTAEQRYQFQAATEAAFEANVCWMDEVDWLSRHASSRKRSADAA